MDRHLDNRSQLMGRATAASSLPPTDLEIVSSLYEWKGTESLRDLVGDWSLSVLHHYEQKLLLAVDFLGPKPLYFLRTPHYIAWSNVLEPLVVLSPDKFALSEDYATGWLYGFPAAELTPYEGIHAVAPGSYVELTRSLQKVHSYWAFRPQEEVRRFKDPELDEGFRHFFEQSVRRRLRSCGPVVSELSGGMDSSAIVCVADRLLKTESDLTPCLNTLSYLDDSEPNWNERPYLCAVENSRGRSGLHVDVNMELSFIPLRDSARFPDTPAVGVVPSVPQQKVSRYLRNEGIRVALSGIGGDETTGGVPDGSAELADLLCEGRFLEFFRREFVWCLALRRPILHMTRDVVAGFFPDGPFHQSLLRRKVPWINPALESRQRSNPSCRSLRLTLHGPMPSLQENLYTLGDLQRQMACSPVQIHPPRDRRYPFLDRDLLEFLYSVPREQVVQPGHRRSLMRRALSGIVPQSVLERKRKAYVARAPVVSIRAQAAELADWTKVMLVADLGLIDADLFHRAVEAACNGNDTHLWRISRTLEFESWLRDSRVQSSVHFHSRSGQPSDSTLSPAKINDCPQLGKPDQKGGGAHEIRETGNHLCG
jgi:asparagine synthase (glutamine-hydrolysing)